MKKTAIAKNKTKKTTKGKAKATLPEDIVTPKDRKQAARLLKSEEEPVDLIWSLIATPVGRNIGTIMAYVEGLSFEAFCTLYEEVTLDSLYLSEEKLTPDVRWQTMREVVLPAMYNDEIESAFDKF